MEFGLENCSRGFEESRRKTPQPMYTRTHSHAQSSSERTLNHLPHIYQEQRAECRAKRSIFFEWIDIMALWEKDLLGILGYTQAQTVGGKCVKKVSERLWLHWFPSNVTNDGRWYNFSISTAKQSIYPNAFLFVTSLYLAAIKTLPSPPRPPC